MTLAHAPARRPVVDVDDPRTWPPALADLILKIADAAELDEPDLYVDLDVEDRESEVYDLLRGARTAPARPTCLPPPATYSGHPHRSMRER